MIGGTAPISTALATRPGCGARDIVRDLAAAGRVADMDGVLEVERVGQRRDVGGVGVHLVAGVGLGRAAVAAAVMRDHAKPCARKNIIWLSQSSALSGQP